MILRTVDRCPWTVDEDGVYWTGCKRARVLPECGPEHNEYGYCQYCGRPILVIEPEALAELPGMVAVPYPIPLEELWAALDIPFADSYPWYVPLKAWVDRLKMEGQRRV